MSILENTEDGDILIFMPGKTEIFQVIRRLKTAYNKQRMYKSYGLQQLDLHPLYSQLDHMLQNKALEQNPNPKQTLLWKI